MDGIAFARRIPSILAILATVSFSFPFAIWMDLKALWRSRSVFAEWGGTWQAEKAKSSVISSLTKNFPRITLGSMTESSETIKEPRVNISITGEHAMKIEQLRELLEKRLHQRLSIAQVIKRLTLQALEAELTAQ